MIDRQWIVLKSYVIPSKPRKNVHQLLHPKYHALVEDDFQADTTTKNDDDSILDIRETRSCLTAPSCQRWPTEAYRRSPHGDDELMSLIAPRILFVDAIDRKFNNLKPMTLTVTLNRNRDLLIPHQMYPTEWDGGNHSWTPYPRGEINQYTHQTRLSFLR